MKRYFAACLLGWFCLLCAAPARAATTINAGSITNVTGPGSVDFNNVLYAVNFNGPNLTVNGVNFVSDTTPPAGFTSVGPQLVTSWQTRPEFGATANDNNFEQIYHDIRWTNSLVDPPLSAAMNVTAGQMYRLQILFYGNNAEFRGWDIGVEGSVVVDNITSLGINTGAGPPAYSPNLGLVYTYDFLAPDSQVNVQMGQLGGVPQEATDGNAIWAGIMLSSIVPEPATALLSGLTLLTVLRRRRKPV